MREKPICCAVAHSSIAVAMESDWVTKARSPGGGTAVAEPVFSLRAGTITPTRSGPTRRSPRACATARAARTCSPSNAAAPIPPPINATARQPHAASSSSRVGRSA